MKLSTPSVTEKDYHDLEFALSRNNPLFLIVKPNQKPSVIEKISDIPKETAIL